MIEHDVFWPNFRASAHNKEMNFRLLDEAGWEVLPELLTATLDGHELLLSHFPYAGDT